MRIYIQVYIAVGTHTIFRFSKKYLQPPQKSSFQANRNTLLRLQDELVTCNLPATL